MRSREKFECMNVLLAGFPYLVREIAINFFCAIVSLATDYSHLHLTWSPRNQRTKDKKINSICNHGSDINMGDLRA